MINYTIAEFLGIFLIGFPTILFVMLLIIRGVFWITEGFDRDETRKNIFHHHYHHKSGQFAPPRK